MLDVRAAPRSTTYDLYRAADRVHPTRHPALPDPDLLLRLALLAEQRQGVNHERVRKAYVCWVVDLRRLGGREPRLLRVGVSAPRPVLRRHLLGVVNRNRNRSTHRWLVAHYSASRRFRQRFSMAAGKSSPRG